MEVLTKLILFLVLLSAVQSATVSRSHRRSSSQDSRVQVGSSTCFEAMTLQSLPIVRNIERYLSGKGFAFRYLLYGCFDYSHHFKIFFYQTDKGTLIFKVTRSGHKMQLNGRPYF